MKNFCLIIYRWQYFNSTKINIFVRHSISNILSLSWNMSLSKSFINAIFFYYVCNIWDWTQFTQICTVFLKKCIEACGNSCIAANFEVHPGGKRKIIREAPVLRLKSCRFKRLKRDYTNLYLLFVGLSGENSQAKWTSQICLYYVDICVTANSWLLVHLDIGLWREKEQLKKIQTVLTKLLPCIHLCCREWVAFSVSGLLCLPIMIRSY